ncbi:glycosyltransferase family 2 protein [Flavobacteriaceae bacterium]|nr:glycosyltransferase family 2 protein [Flavobacteriaceae bacterium]
MNKAISVIISTYNNEAWLEKVLWGYQRQTFKDFEMIIADDGSKPSTKTLVDSFNRTTNYNIIHVWQEDRGFQKSQILNKAIESCNAPYIVMSDGDCIPRADFLEVHNRHKEKGYFLSGGYFKLPMSISKTINEDDIEEQRCFDLEWLKNQGLRKSFKNLKLKVTGNFASLMNVLTPTKATWNGHNASGWKEDIVAINGFDERMQYGGQDRELGERMMNNGIIGKQLRYVAICVHLDHARGYARPESIAKNKSIRRATRTQKKVMTPFGIKKEIS